MYPAQLFRYCGGRTVPVWPWQSWSSPLGLFDASKKTGQVCSGRAEEQCVSFGFVAYNAHRVCRGCYSLRQVAGPCGFGIQSGKELFRKMLHPAKTHIVCPWLTQLERISTSAKEATTKDGRLHIFTRKPISACGMQSGEPRLHA